MANRVVLGQRGGGTGLYVSRPGVNALTATGDDLLLSTDSRMMQFVQQGVVNLSSGSQTISWGPFGYRPRILLVGQNRAYIQYINDNSATLTVASQQTLLDSYWNAFNKPTLSDRIEWFALRPGV